MSKVYKVGSNSYKSLNNLKLYGLCRLYNFITIMIPAIPGKLPRTHSWRHAASFHRRRGQVL